MILGHPVSTGFRKLTGCQRDPRNRGVISELTDDRKEFMVQQE